MADDGRLRLIQGSGNLQTAMQHLDDLLRDFAADQDDATVSVSYVRKYIQSALAAYPDWEVS